MLLLLALHAVLALAAPAVSRRFGPRVFLLVGLAPLAATVWLLVRLGDVLDGRVFSEEFTWVADLGLEVTFRLDGLGLFMGLLVSGIGVLVFLYASHYMSANEGLGRFAASLTLFAGSMLGLVLADNLLLLFVFWELTSLTSYALIGYDDESADARAAARQALLVTAAGGLAMLAGIVLIGQAAGHYSLAALLADPPSGFGVGAGLVLVLLGAFTKSAQVPFHAWLPGAMAAPTPVSAYLHSATMVKAGVYLIARLAPAFAVGFAFWRPLLVTVGCVTMVVGGYRALRQHDLKLLLAYGTVSQLGMMTVLLGAGTEELVFAGLALVFGHSLFKAALFMLVGTIDHSAGTRDLRDLSGLAREMRWLFVAGVLATASMVGLPPLVGFTVKEGAFEALLHAGDDPAWAAATAAVAFGSVLTFAYGARFLWGAFRGGEPPVSFHHPPPLLVGPVVLLAFAGLALGLAPTQAAKLPDAAATALALGGGKLALWHGFTTALALSALVVAVGAALFAVREPVERIQQRIAVIPSGADIFEATVRATTSFAIRLSAVVQSGSLPTYLGIILLTALAIPGVTLLARAELPSHVAIADSPLQAVAVIIIIAGATAAAIVRRRFVAVIFLGAVGYSVAVLFLIQGAPDLALAQILVETLTLVIFVLVLRHLPEDFSELPWPLGRATRAFISLAMGVFVAVTALIAADGRMFPPVSDAHIERALPEGGGRNVVNVILTDFRALDTLGEIVVLTVAAFGIASLVFAGRRTRRTSS